MAVDELPQFLRDNYEVHEWRHATAILKNDFPSEFKDLIDVLTRFRLCKSWIEVGGGNKSQLAKWLDTELGRRGWTAKNFDTKISVDNVITESPTHEIDCFKNRIALELEWNNKDPFYDRDLNNFRLLFDLRAISVGIILTRCDELQNIFNDLGRGSSYGNSTTHMGKLCLVFKAVVGQVVPCWYSVLRSRCMIQIASRTGCSAADDLLRGVKGSFATCLADPPWRFENRTGKMAPEHKRLLRYPTMSIEEIKALPVPNLTASKAHLYLWVPNALLPWGLEVVSAWGFEFKSVITWYKVRKDGGPDGRGVGFYFRNVTEMLLFGVRGKNNRTLPPGRTQTNIIVSRKREHSRKPDEIYDIIERCSSGPYLELFARFKRPGWSQWGNEDVEQNAENGVAKRRGHVDEMPPAVDLRGYKICQDDDIPLLQYACPK